MQRVRGRRLSRYWGKGASGQCRNANGADAAASFEGWVRASSNDGRVFTAPVGTFGANRFGLFDVLGNVWEWVEDCGHASYRGAPSDVRAWTSGGDCGRRVSRGGSWSNYPQNLRAAQPQPERCRKPRRPRRFSGCEDAGLGSWIALRGTRSRAACGRERRDDVTECQADGRGGRSAGGGGAVGRRVPVAEQRVVGGGRGGGGSRQRRPGVRRRRDADDCAAGGGGDAGGFPGLVERDRLRPPFT